MNMCLYTVFLVQDIIACYFVFMVALQITTAEGNFIEYTELLLA